MLNKLSIKNVALIDSAEINFTDGLNVLSGETGAGKSVIIESLNFVLGAKADKTLIRTGESECFVKAEFDVSDTPSIYDIYSELDIEQDDLLIITRKLTIDGKSTVKINGESVNLSMLKKFTALLVDVHGQSEHFHLLKNSNQLNLIDKFGGEQTQNLKNSIKTTYSEYKDIINQLSSLGGDESQRLVRLDILSYQIDEIERVNLQENEEEELLEIRQKLLHQQKITNALSAVCDCISSEGGITDLLSNLSKITDSISEYSIEYKNLSERLNAVFSEVEDISQFSSNLMDNFDFTDYNPNEIEDRLDDIKKLKKKYGQDYAEISKFLSNAKEEKNKLENFNEIAEELLNKKTNLESELYEKYISLSNERRKTAKSLTDNVILELKELGMTKSDFSVEFNDLPNKNDCSYDSANGLDKVEFMFSANLGEPLKPLSNVISGGEMSRFMLSLKTQTAKTSDVSTFIFDEIDSGISGITAKIVAEKLAKISRNVQVVAITHLPQISAMGDNNLLIEKNEDDDRTLTYIKTLSETEKIKEITRLISGTPNSASSIEHAKELIINAKNYKLSL